MKPEKPIIYRVLVDGKPYMSCYEALRLLYPDSQPLNWYGHIHFDCRTVLVRLGHTVSRINIVKETGVNKE